jgi:hypothetical protein
MHPDVQPPPYLNPVTGGMTQPRRWCADGEPGP